MKRGTRDVLRLATIPFGFFPRVVDAMNNGEIRSKSENKQRNRKRGREPVQERSDNQQNETLRALPETDAATVNERFGPRLGIADHHGAGHHKTGEQSVKETIDGGVVDKKAEKNGQIRITMQNGFQKGIEKIDARLAMSERPGNEVARGRGNHGKSGGEKASRAEENAGYDTKDKTREGENTGGDASSRESRDGSLEQPTKGPADNLDAIRHT